MDGLKNKSPSDYAEVVTILGVVMFLGGIAAWNWKVSVVVSGLILMACGGVATFLRAGRR